ncbi:MAG: cupredoxin domain-containing protein [Candidatus Moraniibacteriota bacterium]|nr:MAG: cupredoxin domain-containing protein [Candidatus Moranbacteria bacterium]
MKIIFLVFVGIVVFSLSFLLFRNNTIEKDIQVLTTSGESDNVFMEGEKQIIHIKAKGGYTPRISKAKVNIQTILKVKTEGTFDCSSVITIPSMKISENLPPTGETEIDLGILEEGTIQGTCGMGMYSFQIDVKE